jgi:class 3 adenylate cyclase
MVLMARDEETRYAKTADGVHIAFQAVGRGEHDLLLVEGFVSNVETAWEDPRTARFYERLASFTRLILFDKRGVGLSDRVSAVATLEQRMDDLRAVMDAVGSEQAVLMGLSEGAPMSILFAATYPQRTQALVLYGGMARSTWASDYPWAPPADGLVEAAAEMIGPDIFTGADIGIWAPSLADDERARRSLGRYRRSAVSPGSLMQLFMMFLDIDVRHVLPTIAVPTLVLHRRGDRVVNRRAGQWMASQVPGARYVELPGQDHFPWVGDSEVVLDEVEQFLTGARRAPIADRTLATVLLTDIVGSTQRASELGDRRWRELLDAHDAMVRDELGRHRGNEIKFTGDGVLATFDGPARAIQCACAIRDGAWRLGLEIRAGLHTGEIELRGEDIGGIGVHTAQRVEAVAQPNEVIVSRTVVDLVAGSGFRFEDRGEHTLKGVPGTWRVFRVQS